MAVVDTNPATPARTGVDPLNDIPASGNRFWRVLLRSPAGVIGLLIVLTLLIAALFADWIAPFDPLRMVFGKSRLPSVKI